MPVCKRTEFAWNAPLNSVPTLMRKADPPLTSREEGQTLRGMGHSPESFSTRSRARVSPYGPSNATLDGGTKLEHNPKWPLPKEAVSMIHGVKKYMAERKGFEPLRRFPAYTLSRRAPSTARPPLRIAYNPGLETPEGPAGWPARARQNILIAGPDARDHDAAMAIVFAAGTSRIVSCLADMAQRASVQGGVGQVGLDSFPSAQGTWMRLILRFAGTWLIGLALILLIIDGTRSLRSTR